jgi:hypothetical protein
LMKRLRAAPRMLYFTKPQDADRPL